MEKRPSPLKALSNQTALDILMDLHDNKELSAGTLEMGLELAHATTSRHLANLTAAGLIKVRRHGRLRLYRISDDKTAAVAAALADLLR